MTKLERRCRLLLRAYPAAWRRERGEEILGTLLELTPEGRNWPPGRDLRGLLAGAARARAAIRKREPFSVNIRTPVLVGIATFLADEAIEDLAVFTRSGRLHSSWWFHWQAAVTAPLILAAVALAWVGAKRVYVFAAAWDAAIAQIYWQLHEPGVSARFHWASLLSFPNPILPYVACLAGLVALTGKSASPCPGWLVPAGLAGLSPALLTWTEFTPWFQLPVYLLLAIAAGCIAWIGIDARPAIAMAVLLLAVYSLRDPYAFLLSLGMTRAIISMLALMLIGWRLRRQSVSGPMGRI